MHDIGGFTVVDFLPRHDRHDLRITPQLEGRNRDRPFTRRVRTSSGGLASGTEGSNPGRDRLFPRRLPVELRRARQPLSAAASTSDSTRADCVHARALSSSTEGQVRLSLRNATASGPQAARNAGRAQSGHVISVPQAGPGKRSRGVCKRGEKAKPGRERENGQPTARATSSRQATRQLRSADRLTRAA